jgi:hypothetical protein
MAPLDALLIDCFHPQNGQPKGALDRGARLNPELQSFDVWLERNKDRLPT